MVGRFASRSAGMRLGGIVLVLLLPVLVIGFFLAQSLQRDIDLTARQLLGVEVNDLLRKITIGAAKGKLDPQDVKQFWNTGSSLASLTNDVVAHEEVAALLRSDAPDYTRIRERALAAIASNADASKLILDPESETFHLAVAISHDLLNSCKPMLLCSRLPYPNLTYIQILQKFVWTFFWSLANGSLLQSGFVHRWTLPRGTRWMSTSKRLRPIWLALSGAVEKPVIFLYCQFALNRDPIFACKADPCLWLEEAPGE